MLLARNDEAAPDKGWYVDLFGPELPAIGFANGGINEPHYHNVLHEVYLVAQGTSKMVVDGREIVLAVGDVIVLEPREVHTFVESSPDYFHFVLHCPMIRGDKVSVPHE